MVDDLLLLTLFLVVIQLRLHVHAFNYIIEPCSLPRDEGVRRGLR